MAKRRRWTSEEDLVLIENIHRLARKNLASILPGRTPSAVINRTSRLGLAYCGTSYNHLSYRPSEVAAICGVTRKTVMIWMAHDMLQEIDHRNPVAPRAATGQRSWYYRIPHASVDQFLRDYPMLFSVCSFPGVDHLPALIQSTPDIWLTTKEASRALKLERSTVRKAARAGRLPGRRVLRDWYFRKVDVEHFKYRREDTIRAHQPTGNQSCPELRSSRTEQPGRQVADAGSHAP